MATHLPSVLRRRIEEAHERAVAHMLEVRSLERLRTASRLHDEVIQILTATSIELELLGRRSDDASLTAGLDDAASSIRSTLEQLRTIVFDLVPTPLAAAPLEDVLHERLDREAERAGVRLAIRATIDEEPHRHIKEALFGIATEAALNALRHASASSVEIEIRRSDDHVHLEVRDDGSGFEPPVVSRGGHLGLQAMRRNVEQLGGSLTITTRRSGGTSVVADLPLAGPDEPPESGTVGRAILDAIAELDADYRTGWEASSVGLALVDQDGIFTRVNAAAGRILGTTSDDLVGKRATDVVPAALFTSALAAATAEAAGSVLPDGIEIEQRDADGEVLHWLASARQIHRPAGTPSGWLVSFSPVLDRQATLERLMAEVAGPRIEGAAVYSAIRDATGRIVDFHCEAISPTSARPPADEQIGRTLLHHRPEYATDGFLDACIDVVEHQRPWRARTMVDPYGHRDEIFDVQAVPLHDGIILCWRDLLRSTEGADAAES